eukprot:m.165443 g.165443  ORF g.165443 m.165443 type:complete len:430 (+) comp12562_c0_seq1:97-1386(+)
MQHMQRITVPRVLCSTSSRPLQQRPLCLHLQVQPFGCAFLLAIQHILFGFRKVLRRDLHAPLTQRHEPSLGANGLNVGAREVILGHHKLFQIHIVCQCHFRRMNPKDAPFCFLVGERKFNFAVNPARSNKRWVERINSVGGHNHLDVPTRVKPIQLVQQFQHGALNLAFPTRCRVVPLCPDRVNLIHKDDRRCMLAGHSKQLPDQLGPIPSVLLNQLRADDPQKGCRCLVGNGLGEERLARAWRAVQDNALGRTDPHLFIVLRVRQWEFDGFLDFHNLVVQSANVGIRFCGSLLQFHHRHHRIRIVRQRPNHMRSLVMHENRAPRFQLILVHKRQDTDVVLGADCRRHNGMVVINDFLQCAHRHGRSTQFVHFVAFLLVALLLWLESFLILDELLFHEEVILDAFHLQEPQFAVCVRRNCWKFVNDIGS